MPWPLTDNLILHGFPKEEHIEKYGWGKRDVAMITLCKKQPHTSIMGDLGWWKYFPIPDGVMTPEREAAIWEARNIVLKMMEGSRLTVVHCLAGRNRSALVAGLALQYLYNWTGPETLAFIRDKRPNSIHNEHFETFLNSLGRPR